VLGGLGLGWEAEEEELEVVVDVRDISSDLR
jgi:hypothetical protein